MSNLSNRQNFQAKIARINTYAMYVPVFTIWNDAQSRECYPKNINDLSGR